MLIYIILCSTVLCVALTAPVKQDWQENHQHDQSDHHRAQIFPVTVRLLQSPLQRYDRLGLRALNLHSPSQNDMIATTLRSSPAIELKHPVFHLAAFEKPVQLQQNAIASLMVNYGSHMIGDRESRYGNNFDSELHDHRNAKEKIKSASDVNSVANVLKYSAGQIPVVIFADDKNNSQNGFVLRKMITGVLLPGPIKIWGQGTESKFSPFVEFWVQRLQRYYSNYVYEDLSRPAYDQQYYAEQNQHQDIDEEDEDDEDDDESDTRTDDKIEPMNKSRLQNIILYY